MSVNAPAQSVAGWVTNIQTGAFDQSGDVQAFHIISDSNSSLFSVPPSIDANGDLSYTVAPNVFGQAVLTVEGTDGAYASAAESFNITVTQPTLPDATAGTSYSAEASAPAGTEVITEFVASGSSLPPGLHLGQFGAITGTPTTSGVYTFTVHIISDADPGDPIVQNYTLTINPASQLTLSGPCPTRPPTAPTPPP